LDHLAARYAILAAQREVEEKRATQHQADAGGRRDGQLEAPTGIAQPGENRTLAV
jgi:hypothetical protein